MSKWLDRFTEEFKTTKKVKQLTEEIKKMEDHRNMDKILSEVIKGKWKKKGKMN